jgi:hypothetical protein
VDLSNEESNIPDITIMIAMIADAMTMIFLFIVM